MSDLERLTEALAYFAPVEPDYTQDVYPTWWHLLDAARAYRDLLANGERVEWCEEHQLSELSGGRCATMWLPNGSKTSCRIVSKLLVDLTTEEER